MSRDGGDRASEDAPPGIEGQRVDRWLWFARVVKSRTLAAGLVTDWQVA